MTGGGLSHPHPIYGWPRQTELEESLPEGFPSYLPPRTKHQVGRHSEREREGWRSLFSVSVSMKHEPPTPVTLGPSLRISTHIYSSCPKPLLHVPCPTLLSISRTPTAPLAIYPISTVPSMSNSNSSLIPHFWPLLTHIWDFNNPNKYLMPSLPSAPPYQVDLHSVNVQGCHEPSSLTQGHNQLYITICWSLSRIYTLDLSRGHSWTNTVQTPVWITSSGVRSGCLQEEDRSLPPDRWWKSFISCQPDSQTNLRSLMSPRVPIVPGPFQLF